MSDRSVDSGDDASGEDRLDYEPDYDQYSEGEWEDEEDVPYDDDEEDDESDDDRVKVDKNNVKLCPDHGYGQMTKACDTCAAAFALLKDKKLIKELSSGSCSKEQDLLSRYGGRVDTIKPTLSLDSSTIKLAQKIFTGGVWRDSKMWPEIVKSYLTLSQEQHEELNSDLQVESILRKFRREARFKHIWNYHREQSECLRNLRISQRVIFKIIERIFADLSKVRDIGLEAGLEYPKEAPVKEDGVHVPKREVKDKLKYSKHEDAFPRPDIQKFVAEHGLNIDTANALITFMEDYRATVSKHFMELYDLTSSNLNDTESLLIFYTNLYGHVDGSWRDLLRNRASCLFKNYIKGDVLEQTSAKKMKDEKATGLFGGLLSLFYYIYKLL